MKIFKDRQSAGKLLAKRIQGIRGVWGSQEAIVLGIPRGGVVVAYEVAHELDLPLDIIVTRKIGAPNQKELALGAVDSDGEVVWDERMINDLGLKIDDLTETVEQETEEIKRREKEYRHARSDLARLVEGKVVILVDDGIATGATTLAAIRYLKRHGVQKIILAVPVASKDSASKLQREVDEMVILETPEYFHAVGEFYQKFGEVSDEEVVQLLS